MSLLELLIAAKTDKTKVESDLLGLLPKSPICHTERIEFCQKSIGAIRISVAKSYDNVQRCATSVPLLTNQKCVVVGWW